MHPRRTRLPYCYMDPDGKQESLAKTMLGLFGAYDAVCLNRFTRDCASEASAEASGK
jgi:hypothetical protein